MDGRPTDMFADPPRDDRGETLLEILVAVLIMSVAVVVLLGGLGTSIRMSTLHRDQATAGADVRDFAEAIEAAVAASPTAYVACADPTTYTGIYAVTDPRYTARILAVKYWSGAAFVDTCTPASDGGVQQVLLNVSTPDGLTDETLAVVIRRPCRPIVDFPLDAPCA
jgi:Tfp pilus assembly protein PilV